MQAQRNAAVLIATVAIAIGLTALAQRRLSVRPSRYALPNPLIFVEDGKAIPSLFADVEPLPHFREAVQRAPQNGCRVTQEATNLPSIGAQLFSILQLTSAQAFSCAPSSCAGHYMAFLDRDCSPGNPTGPCGPDGYWFHQSDPFAEYEWGWRYTGASECNGCRCDEATCNNP